MPDQKKVIKAKAEWAARLIFSSERNHTVTTFAVDSVLVQEYEGGTPIAQTVTTEPALLAALLREIDKRKK